MSSQGLPIPSPVIVRGLIDTGASCTCIDPSVIQQLGIPPSGTAAMLTPSTGTTPHQCNQFDVALLLIFPVPSSPPAHPLGFIIPVLEAALL